MVRNTIQRTAVFQTVNKLKNHATAEEIYLEVRRAYPHISKGTVYRNLNKLCEEGEIRRRRVPGEVDRYDHICSDHYHGKCVECGKIMDIFLTYHPELNAVEKQENGFKVLGHDIVFHGICKECQNLKSFA